MQHYSDTTSQLTLLDFFVKKEWRVFFAALNSSRPLWMLNTARDRKYSRLQSGWWGGATLGAGRHVSLHPPPIPLVYTANLIGVDQSMWAELSGENFRSPLTWVFAPPLHRSKSDQIAPLNSAPRSSTISSRSGEIAPRSLKFKMTLHA